MFCPGCGSENSIEQKFCRRCGMNLTRTAESLREQYPDGERTDLQRKEQNLERFGTIAFAGFGVVIAAGIGAMIYAIIVNMILTGTRPAFGILLIAFLFFAAMALGYVVWREALNEKRAKLDRPPAPSALSLSNASTSPLLQEGSIEPVPSVVEDTTELLKQPRK